ncbi:helix-turn-helix transcriptional regulator [Arthrobacter alpinus]|uniref:helix-turn-helix transcriptional regulator n=1 Tax=Arthrobacter alpinus TaxID=656366 RepID=UPI0009F60C49|nr:LuxR family transcriptional regulator [Arthrobacter alpinus]
MSRVQATSTKWQVTGREAIVDAIVGELKSPAAGTSSYPEILGVLLAGPPGIGKSHLAAQAVKALQADVLVVHLYASSHMSTEPYGALAALLSELEPESLTHHVQVLAATLRRLESMANGRDMCILIDNAHELDEQSAVILAQLAKTRSIRLLLTCGSTDLLPHELSNLVKDGFVRRMGVEPFSFRELVKAVEMRLGGRISQRAGRQLWAASGGHPQFLTALTQDMVSSGALLLRDGSWCLDGSIAGHERISSELFSNQLRRLNAQQLRTLEIVALSRAVSINTLLDVVDDRDVDALEEMGMVRIGADHFVRAIHPLLAKVVRNKVPAGRSKEQWESVNMHSPMVHNFASADVGMVLWTLEAGRKLERNLALDAAKIANDEMKPAMALRFLATLDPQTSGATATAEAVRAHVAMGDQTSARNLLASLYSSYHEEPTLTEWVVSLLAETSVLLTSKVTWAEALTNLEKVRGELYPDSLEGEIGSDKPNIGVLRETLIVHTAEAAWWTGNFPDSIDGLDLAYTAAKEVSANQSLLLGSQLCLMNAASGKATAAAELSDKLLQSVTTMGVAQGCAAKARENLFFANLIIGRLDIAEEAARALCGQVAGDSDIHVGAFADLALPILLVVRGHGGESLSLLEQEISQLRLRDEYGALGLALSAGAYACVLSGDNDSAALYLAELEGCSSDAPWLMERVGKYFELAARAKMGDRQQSIRELIHLADSDQDSGREIWEVESLGLALRLGAMEVAPRLFDAASTLDVGYNPFYRDFAEGSVTSDAGLLVRAAEHAAQLGSDNAVVDAAEVALALGTIDQHQHRHLSGLMELCRRNMDANTKRAGDGQPLTSRQLEIAREAAAGASNKDIATRLHVSIRTVEGHLYQIFGKLRISERSDLSYALAQAEGERP